MSSIKVAAAIFRADPTNVGDWWSPPHRYFDLDPELELDIVNVTSSISFNGPCIIGGGGLGRENFKIYLDALKNANPKNPIIAWGVGSDLNYFNPDDYSCSSNIDLLGDYFDNFDVVGSRVWDANKSSQWVPCASAMNPIFDRYYDTQPDVDVLVYSHKRRKIVGKSAINFFKKNKEFLNIPKNISVLTLDNDGNNIFEKISTMARARVVVTNSYHGVYWATLLNKKVICIPFKSGLYSFRHRPHYISNNIDVDDLHVAPNFPDAISECRDANNKFHDMLVQRFC